MLPVALLLIEDKFLFQASREFACALLLSDLALGPCCNRAKSRDQAYNEVAEVVFLCAVPLIDSSLYCRRTDVHLRHHQLLLQCFILLPQPPELLDVERKGDRLACCHQIVALRPWAAFMMSRTQRSTMEAVSEEYHLSSRDHCHCFLWVSLPHVTQEAPVCVNAKTPLFSGSACSLREKAAVLMQQTCT